MQKKEIQSIVYRNELHGFVFYDLDQIAKDVYKDTLEYLYNILGPDTNFSSVYAHDTFFAFLLYNLIEKYTSHKNELDSLIFYQQKKVSFDPELKSLYIAAFNKIFNFFPFVNIKIDSIEYIQEHFEKRDGEYEELKELINKRFEKQFKKNFSLKKFKYYVGLHHLKILANKKTFDILNRI